MAEGLKKIITSGDIKRTGVNLSLNGPDSRGWWISEKKAVILANDRQFQELIRTQLEIIKISTRPDEIMPAVNAVVEYGENFHGAQNAADVSAAWAAVRQAYYVRPTRLGIRA